MKTLITFLLVFAFLHLGFAQEIPTLPPADPNNHPPITEDKASTWIVGGIFLVAAAVGTYVIIKVASNLPSDTKPTTFVLETSDDNYTWTAVATNTVILNGRQPIDCFKDRIHDGGLFYRTRIYRR